MADILSVTSLNLYVKSILENDSNLTNIAVEGELSNFKKYPSGHCYFTLKDEKSSIKAVMFQSYTRGLSFVPENGMKVLVRGKVSLYERDGAYQLYVTNMFPSGSGAYQLAFDRLKEKLEKEGLFDIAKKKPLPRIPFKIGVATSSKGAALHDIISTAQRRFPCAEIILAPCMVQGAEAEPTIINAIKQLDSIEDIDVIIITRGGGSKEDLWVFNSEMIARTAFACKKPTVSAIGHEIDFSILDFVCDVRAATPTQAAEIVLPDVYSLKMQLSSMERTNLRLINQSFELYKNKLALIEKSDGFSYVKNAVNYNKNVISTIESSIKLSIDRKLSVLNQQISARTQILENQSPLNNLKKGYAMIYKDETAVKNYDFTVGESAKIVTFSQELDCKITKVKRRKQ
ncbi:MAG: exodeoxyribonuclease VII large subunit [Oscillospiraceae bacterium]|nr:exodeoxyribonuclease VII large subunit [Oscillospiraceae bacterium]